MVTATTTFPTLNETAIQHLIASMRGEVIRPGDANYDEARKVYNGMIDRHPALIARCVDVADVIAAVNFARDHDVLVSVRGGGHHGAGYSVCDYGLVIDLSTMKGVHVDPAAKTVRAAGGCTLGEVDHATHAFGLATPSGIFSTTGVGGITLGGGVGHFTRPYGLALDNLLEAEVVLADGRVVTANEQQHADLFWAIRGGGGNFGVVTSFLFKLHPVDTVYAGPMLWPIEKAAEVLRWYADFLPNAPDEVNGWFAFLGVPAGPPFPEHLRGKTMCGVVWCFTGPLDEADATFAPIRQQFGGPALDWVGPMPQPALQGMFDPIYPPGLQWYWKTDFFNELTDEAIEQHVSFGSNLPTGQCTMHLYPIDGAAGRVPANATAWNYRDAKWVQVMVGVSPDPADNPRTIGWARDYWAAMHPFSAGGAYVNMFQDEGEDRVKAAYGSNYDRLAEVKTTYDPTNFFRTNHNITPR